jgi:predicted MFS family arabinose efflux permease
MDVRLISMALGTFAASTGGFVIASLLPGIAHEFGADISTTGLLVVVYAIAYAVGTPILAALSGGQDRRMVLAVSMLVYALANIASAIAPNYWTLMGVRIVLAVGAGVFAATATGTAALLAKPEARTRAIAVIVGGSTLAVALGAPMGALIGNVMSWRAAFLSLGVVSLLVAVGVWFMLPKLPGTPLPLRDRMLVVTRPGVSRALLVTLVALSAPFSLFTYIAAFAKQTGVTQDLLPWVLVAFGGGAIVGNYVAGRVADRVGAGRTVGWVIAVMSLITALFSLEANLLPSGVAGYVLIALMVPWGFVGWGFPPAQSSAIVALAPELAPISLALNVSAIYAGIALGSGIGGAWLALHGRVADMGYLAAAVGLLSLALHLWHAPAMAARQRANL